MDGSYNYDLDGTGVDVYVLDTGVIWHPDYSARYQGGCIDYTGEGCLVSTPNRHGTHVAGTAVGTTYGVAKGANLYNYKVLTSTGSGSFGWAAAAVDDITGIKQQIPSSKIVINMSLGGGRYDPMNAAVDQASAAGIVVVVAAGNEATDACNTSPASAVSAITVGATTNLDQIASYSNTGSCVDIYAPGSSILSASIDGGSTTLSGTSMASPHVAGVAALYLQANKNPSVDMIADATMLGSLPLLFVPAGGAGAPAPPAPTNPPTDPPANPDPIAPPPPVGTCGLNGSSCTSNSQCCGGKCNGGYGKMKCVGGSDPAPAPTNPPGGNPSCGLFGASCSAAGHCCSGKCKGSVGRQTCK